MVEKYRIRKKRKKKARRKATPEEKEQRSHRNEVRNIFSRSGFLRVNKVSSHDFNFKGRSGEFDDIFLYKNLIVVLEYTCAKNPKQHLLNKKHLFDLINNSGVEFVDFLLNEFEDFSPKKDALYLTEQFKTVIVYASKFDIDNAIKDQVKNIRYMDYPIAKYFSRISNVLRLSGRHELFAFLGLRHQEIGESILQPDGQTHHVDFEAKLLPETHSNFQKGFKVVTFYAAPNELLDKSYVLRRDGWRSERDVYQRMILAAKIKKIRTYLHEKNRVFVNNLIVTLPSSTQLLNGKGENIDVSTLTKTQNIRLRIPKEFNTIGIIDGQHRLYSYHEGGIFEDSIQRLRLQQNLLVTGIVYPPNVSEAEISKFEAILFLEINSTQSNASSELKQAISLILDPFRPESIAKAIVGKLNERAAFEHKFAIHFFESRKLRTSSIVSYGLRSLIKLSGDDSLFSVWPNSEKNKIVEKTDYELLQEYINFCSSSLDIYFSAVKELFGERWTTDKKVENQVLKIVIVNAFIKCMARYIQEYRKLGNFESYKHQLSGIENFDFSGYSGSKYAELGNILFEKYFR